MRWQFGRRRFAWDERDPTRLMGVVNVTPDSFSDGGRYFDADRALAHALALVESGAQLLDIGGESTRPGAEPVSVDEELRRVVPVIAALRARTDVVLSIDTRNAVVAQAAIGAGAEVVNDITALADPELAALVAEAGVGVVLMHMRGEPRTMQHGDLSSADIVADVRAGLSEAVERARTAGVADAAICVDPGIGFGKTVRQNLELLAGLPRLVALGFPVLVGVSRKSFLGALTGRPVDARGAGTAAAQAAAILAGAHVLRVHDVEAARDVAAVADALVEVLP